MYWVEWFYRPRVQFGFWVNLVFILYTVVSSAQDCARPSDYEFSERARAYEAATGAAAVPYAPLPPPAPPSRVSVAESGGRINVSLNKDLTLVKKTNRTLMLSPSVSFEPRPEAPPATVTLRFTLFSPGGDACPGACMLVVNADGARVIESAANGAQSSGWTRASVPATTTTLEDGRVAETLAAETFTTQVPYLKFVDIISARRVVVGFGPDRVELTSDQIELLREIYRRLSLPGEAGGAKFAVETDRPKVVKAF